MIKMLQERAGCKMQMIQDGPFASAPDKPLRMTGFPENCKVSYTLVGRGGEVLCQLERKAYDDEVLFTLSQSVLCCVISPD